MAGPLALIGPALKALASQGVKKAAVETAKAAAKNKAKNFVTGKGKKGKRGKGGALVKSEGVEESVGGGGGGSIVATTPMVGNYRVEQPPQKPDEVGKPTKVSYEAINNQLDSIIGLTNVLKKTSAAKMQTAINRRKAERKAAEKEKNRLRESLLEAGKGAAGMVGGALAPITKAFDPLKFFTNILFGSLLMWIMANGSKITAFLKMALALMNNAGKLLKFGFQGIGKAFKAGLKLLAKIGGPIIKVGRALKKVLGKVGSKLGKAFGKLGRAIANFGLDILNRIKNAGRALLNLPGKAVDKARKLLGRGGGGAKGTKGKFSPNKGLNKLLGDSTGTTSRATGTAPRKPGTMSNATRSIRLKHGDEAARMYQGMIDNGVKPSRASKYVNEAISKGKLTSQPLQGLARQTGGSQLLKGGVGRSTNRVIAKIGGKNALKMTKALKGALRRIPIVGPLITLIVSLLDPEVSVNQALFRTAGAVVGGFLGTFIPIPVVGTLFGEIIGEYVGDLTFIAMNGGGVEAVGAKMKDDLDNLLSMGQQAVEWIGNGFGRLYEGLPKLNFFGKKFPNPAWLLSLTNFPEKLEIFHKAFFTDKPMEKGKEEEDKTSMTDGLEDRPTGVTNVSTVRRDTEGARAGDFIMASDGTLGVFDGMGTRGLREGEQELFDSGATNVDGTKGSSTPVSTPSQSLVPMRAPNSAPTGTLSQQQAFKKVYDIAKADGRAKFPEIVAAQAMHETGYLVARPSVYFATGQTNAFGQTGDRGYGTIERKGFQDGWTLYPSLEAAVKDHITLWHDVANHSGNYNAFDTPLEGIASVAPAYSPNADPANIRLGYTVDKYSKGMVRALKVGGFDPKGQSGQSSIQSQESQPQTPKIGGQTYTVAGVTYDVSTGLPISGHETQASRQVTPDNSEKASIQNQSDSDTSSAPAQVTASPSVQSQMSSGISGISQNLPYQQVGGQQVVMVQSSGGQQLGGVVGGQQGSMIMMGSQQVLNSYHKSQILGFLYKQG